MRSTIVSSATTTRKWPFRMPSSGWLVSLNFTLKFYGKFDNGNRPETGFVSTKIDCIVCTLWVPGCIEQRTFIIFDFHSSAQTVQPNRCGDQWHHIFSAIWRCHIYGDRNISIGSGWYIDCFPHFSNLRFHTIYFVVIHFATHTLSSHVHFHQFRSSVDAISDIWLVEWKSC